VEMPRLRGLDAVNRRDEPDLTVDDRRRYKKGLLYRAKGQYSCSFNQRWPPCLDFHP